MNEWETINYILESEREAFVTRDGGRHIIHIKVLIENPLVHFNLRPSLLASSDRPAEMHTLAQLRLITNTGMQHDYYVMDNAFIVNPRGTVIGWAYLLPPDDQEVVATFVGRTAPFVRLLDVQPEDTLIHKVLCVACGLITSNQ